MPRGGTRVGAGRKPKSGREHWLSGDAGKRNLALVPRRVDSYGDTIVKGAFRQTLAEWATKGRMPALLWQHDTDRPIGVWNRMREDDHGLFVEGTISDTTLGRDVRTLLRDGAVSGLSIGFITRTFTRDDKTGRRTLLDVDLVEGSIVTLPANDLARVAATKSAGRHRQPDLSHSLDRLTASLVRRTSSQRGLMAAMAAAHTEAARALYVHGYGPFSG